MLRRALGDQVTIHSFSQENGFTVESNSAEWPMERIKQTFHLMDYRAYHDEYKRQNDAIRNQYPQQGDEPSHPKNNESG